MFRKLQIFVLILMIFVVLFLSYWRIMVDKGEMHRAESFKFFVMHSYYSPNPNATGLDYYPPGYFIIPVVFCKLLHLNFGYNICVFLNGLYFILTLIGLFLLTRSILKKGTSALLSCLILMAFPLFLYCQKKLFMEVGIVPWVVFAIYFILMNKNWDDYRKAMLFGIVSGIGLFFKWTFLLYLAGPFAVSLLYALKDKTLAERKRTLSALLLAGFSALIVCGLWYVLRFSIVRWLFNLNDAWATATNIDKSYWSFLKYNVHRTFRFLGQGISYSFLAMLILCLAARIKGIKLDMVMQIFIIWFAFPLVFLCTSIGDSAPCYLLPILPSLSALFVVILDRFAGRPRRLLTIAIIILCAWNIFYETFIYRPARTIAEKPLNPVIKKLFSNSPNKRPLYIGFNGIYDPKNSYEVFDIFVMLWAYKVNDNLPFSMRYFKSPGDLKNIHYYDYIISQQTDVNKQLHREFVTKGYRKMLQFRHHYLENSDPLCDWESYPDYIIFKRT